MRSAFDSLRNTSLVRFAQLAAFALTLLPSAPAIAQDWLVVDANDAPIGVTPEDAVLRYFAQNRSALDFGEVDLRPRVKFGTKTTVVQLEQRYQGLRVIDRGAAARVENGLARALSLDVARHLRVSATPDMDAAEAALRLANRVGAISTPVRTELVVLGRGQGILAWMLDVRDARHGTRYLVDAHSGDIVMRIPLSKDALGRVYSVSSAVTPNPTDLTLGTLDTLASPVVLNGWAGLLQVTNYVSGDTQNGYVVEQNVHPSSGLDFLYDPPVSKLDPTDAFAQVNLFYHLTNIRDFYANLGIDETGPQWKLTAVANVLENGQPLNNAFYSGQGITGPFASPNLIAIGQGSFIDFSYDSDVFKHEFGHYIEQNTVAYDLGPFNVDAFGLQPLDAAIDEGLADYFACSDNDSAVLGEAALAPFGAERYLDDTSKHCPEDIGGESHADGELIGSLGWTIRTDLGQARADQLVWNAVSMLTPGAGFGAFGKSLDDAATAMQAAGGITSADLAQVRSDIAKRGMDDCGPVLAIQDGIPRVLTVVGLDLVASLFGAGCSDLQNVGFATQSTFHLSRVTAASDQALHFHVEMQPDSLGDLEYDVLIQKGAHVSFKTDGNGLPVASGFDTKISSTSETTDIVIDAASSPAFEPGATYYLVVTSTACSGSRMTVTADGKGTPPPKTTSATATSSSTGAGASNGGGGAGPKEIYIDRGCGCVAAGKSDTGWSFASPLAIAGLGLALARRARRRPLLT